MTDGERTGSGRTPPPPSEREDYLRSVIETGPVDSRDDTNTCSYSETVPAGEWHCHRESVDGENHCLFHLPADDTDDEAVAEAFREAVQNPGARAKQFIGAEFAQLDLSHEALNIPDNYPLVLQNATVHGDFDCAHTTIDTPVLATGLSIGGRVSFEHAVFTDVAIFDDTRLTSATLENAEFVDCASFNGSQVAADMDAQGAKFGSDLRLVDTTVGSDVDLSRAHVGGTLRFRTAAVGGDTDLTEATVEGNARCMETEFAGDVSCTLATFETFTTFREATIGGKFDMSAATLSGPLFFTETAFDGMVDLSNSTFAMDVNFREATVGGEFTVRSSDFKGPFKFSEGRVMGDAVLAHAQFEDGLDCQGSVFTGIALDNCTSRGITQLQKTTVTGSFTARAAMFDGILELSEATFKSTVSFERAHITDGQFLRTTVTDGGVIRLDDATVQTGDITLPSDSAVGYDCTRATFGDVRLSVAGETDLLETETRPLFNSFRFHDTTFDGFDFGENKRSLVASNWTLHETSEDLDFSREDAWKDQFRGVIRTLNRTEGRNVVVQLIYALLVQRKYGTSVERTNTAIEDLKTAGDDQSLFEIVEDPTSEWQSYADLENTYLKAKNGADQVGDRKSASEFFMKQMKYRRRKNRDLAFGFSPTHSLDTRERATALGRWIGNYMLHFTCGYGERLWRVVYVSVITVIAWTFMYTLFTEGTTASTSGVTTRGIDSLAQLGTPAGAEILVTNLYFSVVTFTTLGYGDIQPVGTTARFLAGAESFVGALLVALVVFVLGRRVAW